MSLRKHRWPALLASGVACTLLSGCFGSGSPEPTAAHRTRHPHPSSSSTPAESPSTSAPTAPTSSPATQAALLAFSPRSGGKHTDDCQRLVPGDDPAEFLYFPVLVKAPGAVTVDSVGTDHTQGVVDAGAWVAPATSSPQTGTFKGWPPSTIVTQSSQLQWAQRVPAAGATLSAGQWYNVFLHLRVDPTPGDSAAHGIVLTYHDASGSHTDTWRATTTFSMSC